MRTTFPEFGEIALAVGYKEDIQIVGRGATPGRQEIYLAAWQASSTGRWMIPSYNPLVSPQTENRNYAAMAVGYGNEGLLQVVGVGAEDHKIYLVAWQGKDGQWNPYEGAPLNPDRQFKSVALSNGTSDVLHVVGLGLDGRICLAATQDEQGRWSANNLESFDPDRTYRAITLGRSSEGLLHVIGLGTDGNIRVAARQDAQGAWHAYEGGPLRPDRTYKAVAVGNGMGGYLQVAGLGSDDKVYLAAWQDADGVWHTYNDGPLSGSRTFKTVALANGNNYHLQIVGLGQDGQLHLAASQDAEGRWIQHTGDALAGERCSSMAVGTGGGGTMLAVVARPEGMHVAAWLDPNGEWHGEGPWLNHARDEGRWNPIRPTNAYAAFEAVPDRYEYFNYTAEYDGLSEAHFQGMADYGDYYLLTHNRSKAVAWNRHGYIRVINKRLGQQVQSFDTPEGGYRHPGGCQIVGDYLGIEVEDEDSDESIVRFYWLGSMNDKREPTLLPFRMEIPPEVSASALAITDVGEGDNRYYVMALKSKTNATFYRSNGRLLDDPKLQFQLLFAAPLKHGADNLYLITDASNQLHMLAFNGDPEGLSFKDTVDFYDVDLAGGKMNYRTTRHMHTSGTGVLGVHFRYAAGAKFINSSQMTFYACGRNVINGKLAVNLFIKR